MDELLDLILSDPALTRALLEDETTFAQFVQRYGRPQDPGPVGPAPMARDATAVAPRAPARDALAAQQQDAARRALGSSIGPAPESLLDRFAPGVARALRNIQRAVRVPEAQPNPFRALADLSGITSFLETGNPGEIIEGPAAAAAGPLRRGVTRLKSVTRSPSWGYDTFVFDTPQGDIEAIAELNNGKIEIGWIGRPRGGPSVPLGPGAAREVVEQVIGHYPDASAVRFQRISGARARAVDDVDDVEWTEVPISEGLRRRAAQRDIPPGGAGGDNVGTSFGRPQRFATLHNPRTGEVYRGANHAEAENVLARALGIEENPERGLTPAQMQQISQARRERGLIEGFEINGELLTREEAAQRVGSRYKWLHSDDPALRQAPEPPKPRLAYNAPDLGPVANARRAALHQRLSDYAQRIGAKDFGTAQLLKNKDDLDTDFAKRVAQYYDQAVSDPNNPEVRAAYEQFAREIEDQYRFITDELGIEVVVTEDDPYKNSREMMDDVFNNRRLKVFRSNDGDHPLLTGEQNTKFRAVHDLLGHALFGSSFGPAGEEIAFRVHSELFSPVARRAMATETRGQNSWVNFGPYGEANRANPENTRFAEQKVFLMPDHMIRPVPPTRAEEVDRITSAIQEQARANPGGFTMNNETGQLHQPTSGYGVAPSKSTEFAVDPNDRDAVRSWVEKNFDTLTSPNMFSGGWIRPDDGKLVLDASTVVDDLDEAHRIARRGQQEAIWDFARGENIMTRPPRPDWFEAPAIQPNQELRRLDEVRRAVFGSRSNIQPVEGTQPLRPSTIAAQERGREALSRGARIRPGVEALATDKGLLEGLEDAIDYGREAEIALGARLPFYETAGLMERVRQAGGDPGRFMDIQAATSARATVPEQIARAGILQRAQNVGVDQALQEYTEASGKGVGLIRQLFNRPAVQRAFAGEGLTTSTPGALKTPLYAGSLAGEAVEGAVGDTHAAQGLLYLGSTLGSRGTRRAVADIGGSKKLLEGLNDAEYWLLFGPEGPFGRAARRQSIPISQAQAYPWRAFARLTGVNTPPGGFEELFARQLANTLRRSGQPVTSRNLNALFDAYVTGAPGGLLFE